MLAGGREHLNHGSIIRHHVRPVDRIGYLGGHEYPLRRIDLWLNLRDPIAKTTSIEIHVQGLEQFSMQ